MPKTRILLADDHELTRRGMRATLDAHPDLEVVGEATTGREAVEKARQLEPDVIVLDLSMPELNGLEAARLILKELPRAEILILTMHESEELIRQVLSAGARGYLLKSDRARDLTTAIDALRRHHTYFTGTVSQIVLDAYLKPRSVDHPSGYQLTQREREIVQLLAEGKTNKEISSALHISVKTAETHRANIMHKLDLHSIGDLVRYAIRNNIIQP